MDIPERDTTIALQVQVQRLGKFKPEQRQHNPFALQMDTSALLETLPSMSLQALEGLEALYLDIVKKIGEVKVTFFFFLFFFDREF